METKYPSSSKETVGDPIQIVRETFDMELHSSGPGRGGPGNKKLLHQACLINDHRNNTNII